MARGDQKEQEKIIEARHTHPDTRAHIRRACLTTRQNRKTKKRRTRIGLAPGAEERKREEEDRIG